MFTHVMVGANDVAQSRAFYDATLGALGVDPGVVNERGRVAWATPTGRFVIGRPIDGETAYGANGGTIGFAASDPAAADAWHVAGIANGGTSCEDAPGWRSMGERKFYVAYLRDPAGNKICVLHSPG